MRAEAKSWYHDDTDPSERAPENVLDGDLLTFYSVKDADAAGNFLKLYLSRIYRVGEVRVTNVDNGCCGKRIVGTVVRVYNSGPVAGGEGGEVATCGTIRKAG